MLQPALKMYREPELVIRSQMQMIHVLNHFQDTAVKKKFQLLHHLEQPCTDEESLVEAALAVHPRKVVIKRPVKGPLLAGVKPSYQLAGKAVRYDVLVPPRP